MADLCWTDGDFLDIAEQQTAQIDDDDAATTGSIAVVADTDAFATGVWYERYRACRSPAIEAIAARHPGNLYLVTDIAGVPFEEDGIRDGEHLRPWMHQTFLHRLTESNLAHHVLTGSPDQRLEQALIHVDDHLHELRFATPSADRPPAPHPPRQDTHR
jgi:HTH-type transcriptional regulator, transcriptional repressor of NAD biosynthesis genes